MLPHLADLESVLRTLEMVPGLLLILAIIPPQYPLLQFRRMAHKDPETFPVLLIQLISLLLPASLLPLVPHLPHHTDLLIPETALLPRDVPALMTDLVILRTTFQE